MEVSSAKISSKIDLIWKQRDKIRAALLVRVPELQEGIRKAVKQALSFYDQVTQHR